MSRRVVYYGPRDHEVSVSQEILDKLGIPEKSKVTQAQLDRIKKEILEAGRQSGLFKTEVPKT